MNWVDGSIVIAAVAAAINAGAFFAFSNFVMPALAALPSAHGAAAMQSINRFAPTPLFVGSIVGAAAIAVPALIARWGDRPIGWLAAGVGLSLVSFLITVACNVPRNDALEALDPVDRATEERWAGYVNGWTRWNTARALTSAAGVAAYVMALDGG